MRIDWCTSNAPVIDWSAALWVCTDRWYQLQSSQHRCQVHNRSTQCSTENCQQKLYELNRTSTYDYRNGQWWHTEKHRNALQSITKQTCNDNAVCVDKSIEGGTNKTTDIVNKFGEQQKIFSLYLSHRHLIVVWHHQIDQRQSHPIQIRAFSKRISLRNSTLRGIIATRTQIQGVRRNDQIAEWPQSNKAHSNSVIDTTSMQRNNSHCSKTNWPRTWFLLHKGTAATTEDSEEQHQRPLIAATL